ncbi:MAG: glutathione S-transferase [Burkholderiaceae bacterium]
MSDINSPLPILYSFRRCPYAMRARLALRVSQTDVELREVKLSDKPIAMLTASPKATVPVLVLPDTQVIDESLQIMQWALKRSDPQNWLPQDTASMQAADDLIAECDESFKRNLDHYKYPSRYPGTDPIKHRNAGATFIHTLNQRLNGNDYLFGSTPNIADMAIAPFIRQFAMTDRAWFDSQSFSDAIRWLSSFLASPLFDSIMQKHPVWQPE